MMMRIVFLICLLFNFLGSKLISAMWTTDESGHLSALFFLSSSSYSLNYLVRKKRVPSRLCAASLVDNHKNSLDEDNQLRNRVSDWLLEVEQFRRELVPIKEDEIPLRENDNSERPYQKDKARDRESPNDTKCSQGSCSFFSACSVM